MKEVTKKEAVKTWFRKNGVFIGAFGGCIAATAILARAVNNLRLDDRYIEPGNSAIIFPSGEDGLQMLEDHVEKIIAAAKDFERVNQNRDCGDLISRIPEDIF